MKLHRAIIITTDKRTISWKSLPAKMLAIENALDSMKKAQFSLSVEYQDFTPVVENGRITRTSFDSLSLPYLKNGFDFVILHVERKQWLALGIQPNLRGVAQTVDNDEVAEGYFWANEGTSRLGYNQFIETCLHEVSHLFCYGAKRLDETHAYHEEHGTIVGLFKKYDMENYQRDRFLLKKQVSFLQGFLARLKSALKPSHGMLPAVALAADRVMAEMEILGHPVRVVEGYRSFERQAELYAQGRTTPGEVVTKAKPGESLHNYGCAVDFIFRKEGYNATPPLWETLGTIGEKHGLEWGGRWKGFVDKPHFQMTKGYKLKDFQAGTVDYSIYS